MAFRPEPKLPDLTALKSVLLTSGVQQSNNALYQVINQLIDALQRGMGQLQTNINNAGSTIINQTIQQFTLGGTSGDDGGGDGGDTIPGPPGPPGANGMVPYHVLTGEVFQVPVNKQALFSMNIDNEGSIVIDGFLIEVD